MSFTLGAGDIISFTVKVISFFRKQHKKIEKYYHVIWQKPQKIKSKQLFKLRKYRKYYYSRETDKRITACLERKENVAIIGKPLSGKTRAAFEALKAVNHPYAVTIVKNVDIEEDFLLPLNLRWKRTKLVVIDDLQDFAKRKNCKLLIELILRKDCVLLVTCRSGEDLDDTKAVLNAVRFPFYDLFGDNEIELKDIDQKLAKEITEKHLNIPWESVEHRFNGTFGSILLCLSEMENRFYQCTPEQKSILRALRKMHLSGIYREKEVFVKEWIRTICLQEEYEWRDYEWNGLLEKLQKKEFLKFSKESVLAEEAYLETIVTIIEKLSDLDLFNEMLETFQRIPEALVLLGNRSGSPSNRTKNTALLKISIQAYEEALKSYTIDNYPLDYATIMNNIGITYSKLSDIRDKENNLARAIQAFEEALKIRTIDNYPLDYARTMNSLGSAYQNLSDVREKENNLARAIQAYEEALKIYTIDNYPLDYARTINNLGGAYSKLSDVREKENNLTRAIQVFEEALKICTIDNYPLDYAMTMNNLGGAYSKLSNVRDKENNLTRAIQAFEEALKIRTVDNYPLDYAMTMNNLGTAYSELSDIRDKENNLARAIQTYEEALKIRTVDNYPLDYAMTMNNLGSAYSKLSDVREKENNLARAIQAFEETLKIYTIDNYPLDYAMTMNNLGSAYQNLSDVREKENNLARAIQAFEEALKICTIDNYPLDYAMTMYNLGTAYSKLSDIRDKENNLTRAIQAYEETLKIYTINNYTLDYAPTMYNLGLTFWNLAKECDKKLNCMKADKAFQNALKIFTIETFPDYNKLLNEALKDLSEFCQNYKD